MKKFFLFLTLSLLYWATSCGPCEDLIAPLERDPQLEGMWEIRGEIPDDPPLHANGKKIWYPKYWQFNGVYFFYLDDINQDHSLPKWTSRGGEVYSVSTDKMSSFYCPTRLDEPEFRMRYKNIKEDTAYFTGNRDVREKPFWVKYVRIEKP